MAEFDTNLLYRQLFGYVAPPFPVGEFDPSNLLPVKDIDLVSSALKGTTKLGGEIRVPVYLQIPGQEEVLLPNEPIVSWEGGKKMKITPMNRAKEGGKRYTVKEEMRLEDYKITIKGIVYNEDADAYPDTEMRKIRQIIEHPGSVIVRCSLLERFQIGQLSIFDYKFPRSDQATLRLQAYEIIALSDDNFELEIQ